MKTVSGYDIGIMRAAVAALEEIDLQMGSEAGER